MHWNSANGNWVERMQYEDQLEAEQRDLQLWAERLVEARLGFLKWLVRRDAGRVEGLPEEIWGIIGGFLKVRGEGEGELPDIWGGWVHSFD